MLKREHVDGVRDPRRIRVVAAIGGESGLPIGRRRYQAQTAIALPGPLKEGADRLASRIPLRQRRHGVGRILFKEGHKTAQIKLFPCTYIAAEELLLRRIQRRCDRWPAIWIAFGKRLACPLQGTVDRGSRTVK